LTDTSKKRSRKKPATELDKVRLERKLLAESDLEEFAALVQPKRVLGNIHREVINWWTRQDAHNHQLVLMPRDHMKSALIALRATWEITRNPATRILLISSTSNLAKKQLKFIKDILTSDVYRLYWPEMIHKDEAKREMWTLTEISVDHPLRREEMIRDPTIFVAGLTSNIVGMHCDIAILDDVVVANNAYTEDGREKVRDQYSLLSSIETVNAKEWVVGTRYHPLDLYSSLVEMQVEQYDEFGNVISTHDLFEVFERQVESVGDGTGEFLWPRQQRSDGKWFGFDAKILADKRSQYLNRIHFRAQYYNDPHDMDSSPIQRDLFQYYDPQFLNAVRGVQWSYKGEQLNVVAAVDFAYSQAKKADFTTIVVVGASGSGNYYILDIDRFKTDKISEYYSHILKLYEKWWFRKIRAEVSAAQVVIVKDLKENYIRPNGLSLTVEEFRPSRWQGSKEERIMATLQPRYANHQIWHPRTGNVQILEEELMFTNPGHDDVKDALASAIDFAIIPVNTFRRQKESQSMFTFHSKFGGVV
jgi:phage terminase large subunit-like protein